MYIYIYIYTYVGWAFTRDVDYDDYGGDGNGIVPESGRDYAKHTD